MSETEQHFAFFEIDEKNGDFQFSRIQKFKQFCTKFNLINSFVVIILVFVMIGITAHQNSRFESLQSELSKKDNSRILDFYMRHGSAESCNELKAIDTDFATNNGVYLMDPDGRYKGNPAFEVYCDFDTKQTQISAYYNQTNILGTLGRIQIFGFAYDPSPAQINGLIEASGSCYQEIYVNCPKISTALINRVLWIDKNGNQNELPKDQIITECQKPKIDFKIAKDWLLPITGVGIESSNFTGNVTVGRLICTSKFFR